MLTSDISSQTQPDQHAAVRHHAALRPASRSCRRASTPSARELAVVQRKLREERARLTRLRARLLVVRRALAARLVELYKADAPDAITVVLESEGFADLLTRTEFMERVSRQDAKIMDIVADAKADATATAKRLDTLEKRQAKVAKQIESQRDEVSTIRVGLVDRRDRIQSARSAKIRAAARARATAATSSRTTSRALQRPQAKIQAKLAGFSGAADRRPDQARLRAA